ncbi:malonyl-CoA decarboxylase [Sediminicoccus sp. KRV36]|uniref:malonyl-CoA decarboxylase n=1 Tax=Sediminicoccus sp. KRV36 TaxID=3133721 RepID=UPI00200CCF89|nr:malonyl-CoA decarboxylase [Sediminicoccus rosea]UPY38375.1 malonyl-CoA decarboxylase [Sediminicoccus rosea]
MPDTVLSPPDSLVDRALRRVTGLWRDMADRVGGRDEVEDVAAQMQACLAARGGEVSARARAAKLAAAYRGFSEVERVLFLRILAGFDADPKAVERAIGEWTKASDGPGKAAAKVRLRRALESPRIRLLTQFTAIPDGMKLLVDLRADVLRAAETDPLLEALEADLKTLLTSWFDLGFLELRRIDWNSPAALLEKLIRYEAVHRIESWDDLKNRLDSDRRCYAFFHPRMPEEPLIFVEIALMKGLAGSVQALLDPKAEVMDPNLADTAIFYSINNCQRGLDGIAFGNFLIKRVVEVLGQEFRGLKQFATLSPVPGFCRWLSARDDAGDPGLLLPDEVTAIRTAAGAPAETSPGAALHLLLVRKEWSPAVTKVLEPVLVRLCARFVALETGRNPKRAADPVAHFHLSNGARVERINWRADTSVKGMRESAGLMVNYLYDPEYIEDNHEAYAGEGKRAMASAVRKLVKG